MVKLRRPAPLADLAAMLAYGFGAGATAKVGVYEAAARHIVATRSWGAWEGDLCLACGGLFAAGDGVLEAWFACRPEAGRRMRGIAREARLTLALIADAERVEIFARVARDWRSGQRIARAVGFELLEAGPVERWGMACRT